jgi:hypothetical protein
MKYNIGDKIVFINNNEQGNNHFTYGKIYKIIRLIGSSPVSPVIISNSGSEFYVNYKNFTILDDYRNQQIDKIVLLDDTRI